jgi:SIR2-like domain
MDILELYKHYTDPIPDDLLTAFKEKRCVALLGSGVSSRCLSKSRAPLPGWTTLLNDLVQWATERKVLRAEDAHDLAELIASSNLLIVAQELREQIGDERLSEFLADQFDPDAIIPSPLHELLSVVPFRGYITTNYDNLLERAYVTVLKRQLAPILLDHRPSLAQLLKADPFLLKLHGDLETPDSIILAYRDYLQLVADREFQAFLDAIVSDFSLFMVGYGLNDLDIIQSMDRTTHADRAPSLPSCPERNAEFGRAATAACRPEYPHHRVRRLFRLPQPRRYLSRSLDGGS